MNKITYIERCIKSMTLEQKIGQCLVIGFAGTMLTPEVLDKVKRINPAGLRVTSGQMRVKNSVHDPYAGGSYGEKINHIPHGTMKDLVPDVNPPYCTNSEYSEVLNKLKKIALDNGAGIPLHITMDMEGNMSCCHPRGKIKLFSDPCGIANSGDPQLSYDIAWATSRQLRPIGINWLHSPVLDVNTEPMNPEIGTRSYSGSPQVVAEYAKRAIEGFKDGGIIATGKHFPGRGGSISDAHESLPIIDIDAKEIERHLIPFKECIDAGIPSIMTAHTIYPVLDKLMPATLSKNIITGLLKEELGFEGVVTTDAMEMGSILQLGDFTDTIIKAMQAGADLILFRDEGGMLDVMLDGLYTAVRKGILTEERIDDAVRRVLSVKFDYGLFENGNLTESTNADDGVEDSEVARIAIESAYKTVSVLKDEKNILPLKETDKVLLIEQINPLHEKINDMQCHPGILWESLLKHSENVGMIETRINLTDEDFERIVNRIDQAEIIIFTDYFYRRLSLDNKLYFKKIINLGKPVIVITNNCYPTTVIPEYETVICTYSVSPESLAVASQIIYGTIDKNIEDFSGKVSLEHDIEDLSGEVLLKV